jgi:hypothetical protein
MASSRIDKNKGLIDQSLKEKAMHPLSVLPLLKVKVRP